MQCKRTSISARTERRRSLATERSPFQVFSTLPTMTVEVPQILLQAPPAFPTSWVPGCPRGAQRCTEGTRFLRSQMKERAGTAHDALEYPTPETAFEVCEMPQTRTLGSRVSRKESRTTQRRKVRSMCTEARGQFKRVHRCSRARNGDLSSLGLPGLSSLSTL